MRKSFILAALALLLCTKTTVAGRPITIHPGDSQPPMIAPIMPKSADPFADDAKQPTTPPKAAAQDSKPKADGPDPKWCDLVVNKADMTKVIVMDANGKSMPDVKSVLVFFGLESRPNPVARIAFQHNAKLLGKQKTREWSAEWPVHSLNVIDDKEFDKQVQQILDSE